MTEQPVTQAQDHDRRIGRLEGMAEQLDRRLDSIEKRIDSVERSLSEVRQEIAALNRRLDTLTRWLVGVLVASLVAIGSLLFSILSKLPG